MRSVNAYFAYSCFERNKRAITPSKYAHMPLMSAPAFATKSNGFLKWSFLEVTGYQALITYHQPGQTAEQVTARNLFWTVILRLIDSQANRLARYSSDDSFIRLFSVPRPKQPIQAAQPAECPKVAIRSQADSICTA